MKINKDLSYHGYVEVIDHKHGYIEDKDLLLTWIYIIHYTGCPEGIASASIYDQFEQF